MTIQTPTLLSTRSTSMVSSINGLLVSLASSLIVVIFKSEKIQKTSKN